MKRKKSTYLSSPTPHTLTTHRPSNYPSQGVPGPFIKPVQKLIEAIGSEMVSGPVVEPAKGKTLNCCTGDTAVP